MSRARRGVCSLQGPLLNAKARCIDVGKRETRKRSSAAAARHYPTRHAGLHLQGHSDAEEPVRLGALSDAAMGAAAAIDHRDRLKPRRQRLMVSRYDAHL